jgi:hypothetical protein
MLSLSVFASKENILPSLKKNSKYQHFVLKQTQSLKALEKEERTGYSICVTGYFK